MLSNEKIVHLSYLVQQWMHGTITIKEFDELNSWYSALEGKELGMPEGIVLDRIELRLTQMMMRQYKPQPLPPDFDVNALFNRDK